MKLTVEINGDDVKYSYEIGTSTGTATSPLSADWLEAFTDMLRLAHSAWQSGVDERHKRIISEALNKPSAEEGV